LAEVFAFFALVMIKIRKNGNEKEFGFALCCRADSRESKGQRTEQ
jgi:hypothetical protein